MTTIEERGEYSQVLRASGGVGGHFEDPHVN